MRQVYLCINSHRKCESCFEVQRWIVQVVCMCKPYRRSLILTMDLKFGVNVWGCSLLHMLSSTQEPHVIVEVSSCDWFLCTSWYYSEALVGEFILKLLVIRQQSYRYSATMWVQLWLFGKAETAAFKWIRSMHVAAGAAMGTCVVFRCFCLLYRRMAKRKCWYPDDM